ncbi:MAG: hypothetical protein WAO91_04560 [Candidatus Nitrosotenuis sp.]
MILLLVPLFQLGNLTDANGQGQQIDEKTIFQYKADDVKAKLAPNPVTPLIFELVRDFAKSSKCHLSLKR